jgi:hypothetical protein
MTAPDPTYVRMFNSRRDWNQKAARRQIDSIAQDVETLRRDLEKGGKVFASQARALADQAVLLTERLATLETLDEVAFITTDPDAAEVSR